MAGKSRKLGLIVGGALIAIGAIFVFTYSPDTTPAPRPPLIRPAKTIVVEAAGQIVKRSFTGVVQAVDQVDLSFRVSGPLVQLPVKAGDRVKQGDLIAQIDPRDFETALGRVRGSLESARSTLAKMKAGERIENIRILENAVSAARLAHENAAIEEARYRKLFEGGTESKSRYDQAKLAMDVASEKLDAAKQDLARGKKGARQEDLDAQEAQIRGLVQQEKEALDALSDSSLKAPFDGRIAKRYVENFQLVRAKNPVVSVQDMEKIKVIADVPESVMALLKQEYIERMTVTFDLPGKPEFDVTIDEVNVEADPRSQTYAVTVVLPSPKAFTILSGMSSSLRLYLNDGFLTRGGGVAVPGDAVFNDPQGKSYVWIVQEPAMTVKQVAVTMGEVGGTSVFVREGLTGGERVVTAGVHFLAEGQQIRLLETKN